MKMLLPIAMGLMIGMYSSQANEFKVIGGAGQVGPDSQAYVPAKVPGAYPLKWWAKTEGKPLKIAFSPENIFRLLPRSEVQITGTGASNSKFRRIINLKAGKVDLDLKKLQGSRVDVETPTAICGAVGTKFTVDAETGSFQITKGQIHAKAKSDSGFEGKSIHGTLTLAPGTQNAFTKANVTGSYLLNGVPVEGKTSVVLAKAKGGTGQAAIRIDSGSVSGKKAGVYLMNGGALEPVTESKQQQLHQEYLQAAQKEGDYHLQYAKLKAQGKEIPAPLQQNLSEAAERATQLRKRLFARRVIRDTAKENAREAIRQQTMRQPVRSHGM